jgi:hypothetical protein
MNKLVRLEFETYDGEFLVADGWLSAEDWERIRALPEDDQDTYVEVVLERIYECSGWSYDEPIPGEWVVVYWREIRGLAPHPTLTRGGMREVGV